ncbi:hypothetical protein M0811_05114 [Anaeramoeba ignava]|uniref:Uncharacterized protein n=1 Tax=Anaeramoeba ignava TaxID=1746090 RepID=A0A9Q0REZ6_ANAIG|nr:hypothetical protein M0811_05114 [Anaeramoeba ignava]
MIENKLNQASIWLANFLNKPDLELDQKNDRKLQIIVGKIIRRINIPKELKKYNLDQDERFTHLVTKFRKRKNTLKREEMNEMIIQLWEFVGQKDQEEQKEENEKEEQEIEMENKMNDKKKEIEEKKEKQTIMNNFVIGKATFLVEIFNGENNWKNGRIDISEEKITVFMEGYCVSEGRLAQKKEVEIRFSQEQEMIICIVIKKTKRIIVKMQNEKERKILWKTFLMFSRYYGGVPECVSIDGSILGVENEIQALVSRCGDEKEARFIVKILDCEQNWKENFLLMNKKEIKIYSKEGNSFEIVWEDILAITQVGDNSQQGFLKIEAKDEVFIVISTDSGHYNELILGCARKYMGSLFSSDNKEYELLNFSKKMDHLESELDMENKEEWSRVERRYNREKRQRVCVTKFNVLTGGPEILRSKPFFQRISTKLGQIEKEKMVSEISEAVENLQKIGRAEFAVEYTGTEGEELLSGWFCISKQGVELLSDKRQLVLVNDFCSSQRMFLHSTKITCFVLQIDTSTSLVMFAESVFLRDVIFNFFRKMQNAHVKMFSETSDEMSIFFTPTDVSLYPENYPKIKEVQQILEASNPTKQSLFRYTPENIFGGKIFPQFFPGEQTYPQNFSGEQTIPQNFSVDNLFSRTISRDFSDSQTSLFSSAIQTPTQTMEQLMLHRRISSIDVGELRTTEAHAKRQEQLGRSYTIATILFLELPSQPPIYRKYNPYSNLVVDSVDHRVFRFHIDELQFLNIVFANGQTQKLFAHDLRIKKQLNIHRKIFVKKRYKCWIITSSGRCQAEIELRPHFFKIKTSVEPKLVLEYSFPHRIEEVPDRDGYIKLFLNDQLYLLLYFAQEISDNPDTKLTQNFSENFDTNKHKFISRTLGSHYEKFAFSFLDGARPIQEGSIFLTSSKLSICTDYFSFGFSYNTEIYTHKKVNTIARVSFPESETQVFMEFPSAEERANFLRKYYHYRDKHTALFRKEPCDQRITLDSQSPVEPSFVVTFLPRDKLHPARKGSVEIQNEMLVLVLPDQTKKIRNIKNVRLFVNVPNPRVCKIVVLHLSELFIIRFAEPSIAEVFASSFRLQQGQLLSSPKTSSSSSSLGAIDYSLLSSQGVHSWDVILMSQGFVKLDIGKIVLKRGKAFVLSSSSRSYALSSFANCHTSTFVKKPSVLQISFSESHFILDFSRVEFLVEFVSHWKSGYRSMRKGMRI